MSGKIMGQVYDRRLPASERDVLLALADHADHDGDNAWCSVGRLAYKLGCATRTVQRNLRSLEQRGVLVSTGKTSQDGCTVYRIHLHAVPLKQPYQGRDVIRSMRVKRATVTPRATVARGRHHGDTGGASSGCHPPRVTAVTPKPYGAVWSQQLAAAAAAGAYLSFKGQDLTDEWYDAIGDDTPARIAHIFARKRPNGQRIRMPASYAAAKDLLQAEAEHQHHTIAARGKATAQAQDRAAEAAQARAQRDYHQRLLRAASEALHDQRLPAGYCHPDDRDTWTQFRTHIEAGRSWPWMLAARLRRRWPGFAQWIDALDGTQGAA